MEQMKDFLKRHIIWLSAVLLVLLAGGVFGIYSYANRPCRADEAYTMSISHQKARLAVGETLQERVIFAALTEKLAKRAAADFETAEVEWTSDDPSVARVDGNGLIRAVYTGKTKITARMESLKVTCEVEVYVPLEGIALRAHEVRMDMDGGPLQFGWDLLPADAEQPASFRFSSSDEKVGVISHDGTFTPLHPGTTTVTVSADGYRDSCAVTVKAMLKSIELSETDVTIEGGKSVKLEVTYDPDYTTDSREVEWSSSDESVARVDQSGTVTAYGPGHARIRAKCGICVEYCEVEVVVPMRSISFSFQTLEMRLGDTIQIPVMYEPWNTTDDRTVTWTSSDPAVVTVDEEGVVTTVGPGTASVTAACGPFTASAEFTVVIPVTDVIINYSELTINVGQAAGLSAAVLPENTTEDPYITWSSDNPSVAYVNEGGAVLGMGPGTATITANHDLVGASCVVTVLSPITSIEVTPGSLSLVETMSTSLGVLFYPADTTDDRTVTWSSDNPDVATVDASGTVTAVRLGSCHIIATVGSHQASAYLTVTPYVEVDSVTISETSHTLTAAGQSFALTATYEPADATIGGIAWSSSDASVASVDGNGVVTAVSDGTAVITAQAGSRSASCTVTVSLPVRPKVVVIDPGHAYQYPGASYGDIREEIITLVTAQACKAYLESHYEGVTVYLTRENGNCVDGSSLKSDLEGRAQIAQNYGADLLVSIHYNASVQHNAAGCLAFVSFQPNVADRCIGLAERILPKIAETFGITNLGVVQTQSDQYFDEFGNPQDYYAINRHCANRGIPGIIIEHCFMDTQTSLVSSNDSLVQFGVCDALGIAEFLGLQPK